jgi:hypothetical protein
MRRHILGILAILLLLGGVVFLIWPPGEGEVQIQLESACWRIGACLAALWLAYPDLLRVPRWFWLTLPVLIVILAKWPRLFLLLIPVLILYAIFRPLLVHRSPTKM